MMEDLKPLGTGQGPGKLSQLLRLMGAFGYCTTWAVEGHVDEPAERFGIDEPPNREAACGAAWYLISRTSELLGTMQDCMGIAWIREIRVSVFRLKTHFPVTDGRGEDVAEKLALRYYRDHMGEANEVTYKLLLLKEDLERVGGIEGWYEPEIGKWLKQSRAAQLLAEATESGNKRTYVSRLSEGTPICGVTIETNGVKGTDIRYSMVSIGNAIFALQLKEFSTKESEKEINEKLKASKEKKRL